MRECVIYVMYINLSLTSYIYARMCNIRDVYKPIIHKLYIYIYIYMHECVIYVMYINLLLTSYELTICSNSNYIV